MITPSTPESASIAWRMMLREIQRRGQRTSPRGLAIDEVLGHQSVVDMKRPVLLSRNRRLSYAFMAAEAYWILSGRNDVEYIEQFAKSHARFSDNGQAYFGAYGPRYIEQLPYVIDCLSKDRASRQAVISLWRERPPETADVPCTLSLQWLIRLKDESLVKSSPNLLESEIHCIATMRSSDAWLGWPYDVFTFSMMSAHVAHLWHQRNAFQGYAAPQLGSLILTAGSQHLYD